MIRVISGGSKFTYNHLFRGRIGDDRFSGEIQRSLSEVKIVINFVRKMIVIPRKWMNVEHDGHLVWLVGSWKNKKVSQVSYGVGLSCITIDVIDLKLTNALAMPGDHVLVTSGLIELATSPDMLAGVIAHEIAHLDLRHPTQSAISNLGISATVSIILGGSSAGDVATLLTIMSYSRKMEAEADLRGLDLLKSAGLRADGMAQFFKVMEEKMKSDGDSLLPDWLASHPGLDERADYTKADTAGATAMTDAEWQTVKNICQTR